MPQALGVAVIQSIPSLAMNLSLIGLTSNELNIDDKHPQNYTLLFRWFEEQVGENR